MLGENGRYGARFSPEFVRWSVTLGGHG